MTRTRSSSTSCAATSFARSSGKGMKPADRIQAAARRLLEAHELRERFRPLPKELAPRTEEEAYAIQDGFVALRAKKLGGIAGYKIALATAEMQRFVGVDAPQAGAMLEFTLHRTPAWRPPEEHLRRRSAASRPWRARS